MQRINSTVNLLIPYTSSRALHDNWLPIDKNIASIIVMTICSVLIYVTNGYYCLFISVIKKGLVGNHRAVYFNYCFITRWSFLLHGWNSQARQIVDDYYIIKQYRVCPHHDILRDNQHENNIAIDYFVKLEHISNYKFWLM